MSPSRSWNPYDTSTGSALSSSGSDRRSAWSSSVAAFFGGAFPVHAVDGGFPGALRVEPAPQAVPGLREPSPGAAVRIAAPAGTLAEHRYQPFVLVEETTPEGANRRALVPLVDDQIAVGGGGVQPPRPDSCPPARDVDRLDVGVGMEEREGGRDFLVGAVPAGVVGVEVGVQFVVEFDQDDAGGVVPGSNVGAGLELLQRFAASVPAGWALVVPVHDISGCVRRLVVGGAAFRGNDVGPAVPRRVVGAGRPNKASGRR